MCFQRVKSTLGEYPDCRYNLLKYEGASMKVLIVLALVMSFSAIAQTRVKENIKQQSIATSADGSSSTTKSSAGKPRQVKR